MREVNNINFLFYVQDLELPQIEESSEEAHSLLHLSFIDCIWNIVAVLILMPSVI